MASYHRAAQGSPATATSANPMYYATAGAQTTSSGGQPPQAGSRVPTGYPSATPRGGPPGFASRAAGGQPLLDRILVFRSQGVADEAADQGDFPALGTHATSSYASQAQPGQYLSQQPLAAGLQPPGPPPGLSAPGSATSGGQSQTNGTREDSLGAGGGGGGGGEDFPALGGASRGGPGSVVSDGKDRVRTAFAQRGTDEKLPSNRTLAVVLPAESGPTYTSTTITSYSITEWRFRISLAFQFGSTVSTAHGRRRWIGAVDNRVCRSIMASSNAIAIKRSRANHETCTADLDEPSGPVGLAGVAVRDQDGQTGSPTHDAW